MCRWSCVCGLPEKYWPNQAINDFPGRVLLHVVICVKVPGHGPHAHALKAYKGSRIRDPLILYISTNCRCEANSVPSCFTSGKRALISHCKEVELGPRACVNF